MCAARADVNIQSQLGVETTPGTAVPADKRFPSIDIEISPEHTKQFFRGAGQKFNTIGVMNKNWSVGSYKGALNYSELAYVLASYSNLTTGSEWTFSPAPAGDDIFATYTIERGDSTTAAQATNAIFNTLDIEITRDTGTIAGEVMAKLFSVGHTLTASPTTLPNTPVSMNDVKIFLDSDSANLGTTKLTDVFKTSIKLPKKFDLKWVIDADETSWKDAVPMAMTPKVTLEAEFSPQMEALYNVLKSDNAANYFLRALAVGDPVGSTNFTFRFSAAVQMTDAKENRKGNGAVYGYNFEFEIVADAIWGKAWEIFLINGISAL
jgi:hypothetical protein